MRPSGITTVNRGASTVGADSHRKSNSSRLLNRVGTKKHARKRQNPASAYIGKQARSTQETQRTALASVAAILLDKVADPEAFAWHQLTYGDVVRLREALVARFAPATVNRILAAVRGTLREAWAGELLDPDTRDRLIYGLKNVRVGRLQAGRVLARGEVEAVIRACLVDPTPAGLRDGAIVALMVGAGLRRGEVSHLVAPTWTWSQASCA